MRISIALLSIATTANSIWPLPVSQTTGDQVLFINRDVAITYDSVDCNPQLISQQPNVAGLEYNNGSWTDAIIANAIARTRDTLFSQNFVPWKFHPRMSGFEPARTRRNQVKSIKLRQNASDPKDIERPDVDSIDESYTISMTLEGDVSITALSSIGLLYGLTTFTQLFYKHTEGHVYTTFAPVEIADKPLFKWRGLNVDTSRAFMPMSEMYALIDALSYNKMNRLHWHVTDAQSWPLVIPSMPDLADKGALVSWQKYSPKDIRDTQAYGALLGVTVVLEIDMPGHTSAIWHAYPDLIAAFEAKPWISYCAEPPCGTLKLNSTAVYDFLERLLGDLLPRIEPLTRFFHLGGDEVNLNSYTLDDTVFSNKSSIVQPLLQNFMDRNQNQTQAAGFTPLVWEEQLLDFNLSMPKNTIIQTWRSDRSVAQTVQRGYRALAGNYQHWYLDCGHGQWVDFHPGRSSRENWPYQDYCAPLHNWRVMYSYDPFQGIQEDLQHLVIGGEVHLWAERTDELNLHQMVWPRTCAAAEVLWSGPKDAEGRNRSQVTASPRLSEMRERLVARGIRAEPVQMPFCTQDGVQCVM